ncbi:MAG: nucleotidyltransferase domain-containing protein [Nanoarchaeota archaeon]|nr:nucleotidyltransferase domain-containing protein [Nanoarchaeota archaeon]
MKKLNEVLNRVLDKITPEKNEVKIVEKEVKNFIEKFKKDIKKNKIKADIFTGGSFAKGTAIRKKLHDVDLFVRFSKEYPNEKLSSLLKRLLKNKKNVKLIHGSRDYYRVFFGESFFIELIPVYRITRPKDAENITDLSYSHVNYVKKKTKDKKLLNEIKLAKAFCQAQRVYGAESYIKGFSGYSIELLIIHYGSFVKLLRAIANSKDEKIVIDQERLYKNKKEVLMDLNGSKLDSPIVLIDPTHKARNALAALSEESFNKFKNAAKKFLKSPSIKDFFPDKLNLGKLKEDALKNKNEFIEINLKTNKQEGDIAGSKLKKFYNHLSKEISKYFEIKRKGFSYGGKKQANCFFVVKKRKEIVIGGPLTKDKKNIAKFRKKHKNTFAKKGRIYSRVKVNFSLDNFLKGWISKNKVKLREMDVLGVEF